MLRGAAFGPLLPLAVPGSPCSNLAEMLALRPVHLFICLIVLAAAGCANTSVQGTQTSGAGAPPRPKTVLVYDFVFSSDAAVVDPEFTTRLERQIGNLSVSKQLIAKRVNDEIVATLVTILRYEAGLNAQPGSEEEPTLKDGALVITGQLRAVDQGNRPQHNPVGFGTGGGVAADMTVSQVSEGAKKAIAHVHGASAVSEPVRCRYSRISSSGAQCGNHRGPCRQKCARREPVAQCRSAGARTCTRCR
jgi:hypothetical protein